MRRQRQGWTADSALPLARCALGQGLPSPGGVSSGKLEWQLPACGAGGGGDALPLLSHRWAGVSEAAATLGPLRACFSLLRGAGGSLLPATGPWLWAWDSHPEAANAGLPKPKEAV